jgi:hypothetical protein
MQNFWMLSTPMIVLLPVQGEAGSLVASCARREILALHTRRQGYLDRTRIRGQCAHLNRPRYACLSANKHEHAYMIAVSVSSSRAETKGQTRNGCILRGDQEVVPNYILLVFNLFIVML